MKVIPPDLLAIYQAAGDTIVDAVRIERPDGTIYTLTAHDRNAVLATGPGDADETYLCRPGYELSQLVSTAGLAVDNAEFRFLEDSDFFSRLDMLAGKLDDSAALLIQYAWKNPAAGVHVLKAGWLGNLKPRRAEFVAEFRDLRQPLQANATWVTQKTCRWRLGSTALPDGLCGVDLEPFTFTGTVESGATQYGFTDSGLVQAADYFGNGLLTWLTGPNAGVPPVKVRSFEAGGEVGFVLPMIFPVGVGDTFSIVAGCRMRHAEDCVVKFDNGRRFGGEKDAPTPDEALSPQLQ
jgi:uncharacterized phage protein (TIGR02218 family)